MFCQQQQKLSYQCYPVWKCTINTITSKGKMMTFRKINKKWLVESGACALLEAVCNVFIPAKEEKEEKRETTE